MEMIVCTKCAKQLEPSRFHKSKRDGYQQPCKTCKQSPTARARAEARTLGLIRCSLCEQPRPSGDFYAHPTDGISQPCKPCRKTPGFKAAVRDWLASPTGKASRKAATAKWLKTESGKAYKARSNKATNATEAGRRARSKWNKTHPETTWAARQRWLRKREHLRRLTKAFAIIAQEALQNGLQNTDQ